MNSEMAAETIAKIKAAIVENPDFPRPGVIFMDTLPLFKNMALLRDTISMLADHIKDKFGSVDIIVGLEAKGFLYAPLVAVELGCQFVPIRKIGKLPGELVQLTYSYNGNKQVLEAQVGAIKQGQTVVIVDDLLLSGEYASAAEDLVQTMGGNLVETLFLCEVVDQKGVQKLKGPFHSIIQY